MQTKRERMQQRKAALENERSSWMSHWREIADLQMPRNGRFFASEANQGGKKHNHIHDNTPVFALRTLAAGMMAGMTSPARPWFRLTLEDAALAESAAVKTWLHDVERLMRAVFAKSNTYRTLHGLYKELGAFGTAATFVLPDFDSVIHHYPLTVGEYAIATNHRGQVDTLVRSVPLTVEQVVGWFGVENVSPQVKNMWDTHKHNQRVNVTQIVEPNREHKQGSAVPKHKKFASCYFEEAATNGKFLRESGFSRFPALVPRWEVRSSDDYGHSPGMECLGDVKQLQFSQLRKAQGIDYLTNPPLQVPSQYKDKMSARLPGGVFYVDQSSAGGGVRTAFDVRIDLTHLLNDIEDVRGRVNSAYYADLFLMLANDTRSGITATEVAQRHEEKLLMLGPVLERLNDELLIPLIDLTFEYCAEAGVLPPPPKEIRDMDVKVEFISTLAQAQRAVSVGGIDNMLNRVAMMAQAKPEVLDKLDFDQIVDDTAEMLGINPKLIVPDDAVANIRAEREKQIAAAQAASQAPQAVTAAKTASEIDPAALGDVMQNVMGYSTPGTQLVDGM